MNGFFIWTTSSFTMLNSAWICCSSILWTRFMLRFGSWFEFSPVFQLYDQTCAFRLFQVAFYCEVQPWIFIANLQRLVLLIGILVVFVLMSEVSRILHVFFDFGFLEIFVLAIFGFFVGLVRILIGFLPGFWEVGFEFLSLRRLRVLILVVFMNF